MDLLSGLKSEIFRPLVTLLIPGVLATAPWWGVLFSWFPAIFSAFVRQPAVGWVVTLGAALAAGMILENVGSRIEHVWDWYLNKRTNGQHSADWSRYLQLLDAEKLVGHRYLRTLLVRMKFELSMAPAMLIAAIGLWMWNARTSALGQNHRWFEVAVIAVGIFFACESFSSAGVMSRTRADVLRARMSKFE